MQEITFSNTRFDPDLTPFHDLAKQMAKAFGYIAELDLDPELAQLLRLRVASFNTCSYCIILHADHARTIGIHPGKVDNIISYTESNLYTDQEKTALQYSDALTVGSHEGFDDYHQALAVYFSEKEIAEIAAIVINMNVWTRLKLAQGQRPQIVQ